LPSISACLTDRSITSDTGRITGSASVRVDLERFSRQAAVTTAADLLHAHLSRATVLTAERSLPAIPICFVIRQPEDLIDPLAIPYSTTDRLRPDDVIVFAERHAGALPYTSDELVISTAVEL